MAKITIPKDYFDTLIRRAELHLTSEDDVTISRAEHNALVCEQTFRRPYSFATNQQQQQQDPHHHPLDYCAQRIASNILQLITLQIQCHSQYQSLRAALLAGGATSETLDVLINATPPRLTQSSGQPWSTDDPFFASIADRSMRKRRVEASSSGNWLTHPSPISASPNSYGFEGEKSSVTSSEKANDVAENCRQDPKTQVQWKEFDDNHEDRTLLLTGLSNRTTLADITKAVRGGQLLNLYIRRQQRTAHVSFVNPLAAEAFLIYSKRTDLYIRGKRVEVSWSERQRFMPAHVEHKIIRLGASRNLVIRFPKPDMTADGIRDDLEHINNLEVVDVITLLGGHLLVSTNDVSLAVTARICMVSRLKYKGSRVEFYPDECCEPLPPHMRKAFQRTSQSLPKPASVNRFEMLARTSEGDEGW